MVFKKRTSSTRHVTGCPCLSPLDKQENIYTLILRPTNRNKTGYVRMLTGLYCAFTIKFVSSVRWTTYNSYCDPSTYDCFPWLLPRCCDISCDPPFCFEDLATSDVTDCVVNGNDCVMFCSR